jgi:hypothetical protein
MFAMFSGPKNDNKTVLKYVFLDDVLKYHVLIFKWLKKQCFFYQVRSRL